MSKFPHFPDAYPAANVSVKCCALPDPEYDIRRDSGSANREPAADSS
jgi:hypothetical protein